MGDQLEVRDEEVFEEDKSPIKIIENRRTRRR
jgi:hypothetical protein